MPVLGEWDSNNNDCSLKPDGVQPDLREADGPHYMNLSEVFTYFQLSVSL